MPFCPSCGAPVEGKFCAKCGSAVGAAAPAGAAPGGATPGGAGAQPAMAAAAPMADNVASMLCYVLGFITGIVFLVMQPYNQNRTVRFHAFQSIFLSVGVFIIRWAFGIVMFSMFHFWSMLFLISLIDLAIFALWLFMLIATYQGKTIVLPLVGPLAQQQAQR